MPTVLLTGLVILINLFLYGAQDPLAGFQNSYIATHLYYGVMILAGRYSQKVGQYTILALTTGANLIYVSLNPNQFQFAIVATIYPFIAVFIVCMIQWLKAERQKTADQLHNIDLANLDLAKQIHSLSTIFDVSQLANMRRRPAATDLDTLLEQGIRVLAKKMGIHRGTLRIWSENQLVRTIPVTVGLTEAEIRRGQIDHIDEICRYVLDHNEPVAILHDKGKMCAIEEVESKNKVASWCLPIIINQQSVATLTIDKAADRFSIEEDIRTLTIVASILAQRVEIQQIVDSLVEAERLATLGKIATTIAHEVRNPLGGIRGSAQLLELDNYLTDESRTCLNIILKEVDRLNRVVEELLIFGRPYQPNFQTFDLGQIIEKTLELCRVDLDKHRVQVERRFASELPLVEIDQGRMRQVLLNLFRNAIESMDDHGILTVYTSLCQTVDQVQIRVEDTGCCIEDKTVPHLFDPFFTTKQKGTGIGLALSRQIVAEHGGTIEVDVTKTEGTAFIITLPVEQCVMGARG